MKTFRYRIVILTILLMGMGTGVQAQDDERALGAATDTICRIWGVTKKQYVYRIVEKVFEDHPTASFATRIAKSFYSYNENSETHKRDFHISDTVAAFRYIRRSIELDPKYAEAYVVASDILDYGRKDDEAMRWLDEGVKHNPSDPSLYMAQAKLLAVKDEQGAVAKIEEIRKHDPKFPVDLELARMYYKLFERGGSSEQRYGYYEKVVEYYLKADKNDMTVGDLGQCCMAISYVLGSHSEYVDKWYELTTFGVQKFPEDIAMRKFLLYACRSGQKWDEGIAAAGSYFSMIDAAKVQPIDYLNYGICLRNVKRYDEAIAQYEKVINMEDCAANLKNQAENLIATAISNQVDEVRKAGDYQKAITIIKPYIDKNNAAGKQNDYLMSAYAKIYTDWAVELSGTEQEDAIRKAISIYDEASKKSELNTNLFIYQCCINSMKIDRELKNGLAMPYAQTLVNKLDGKDNLASNDRAFLLIGYECMMRYEYFVNNHNKKGAIAWAEKMLDVDPSNQTALQFVTAVSK